MFENYVEICFFCRAKVRSPTVSNRFLLDTFGPSKKNCVARKCLCLKEMRVGQVLAWSCFRPFPTVSDRFIFSERLFGPIPFMEGWSSANPCKPWRLSFSCDPWARTLHQILHLDLDIQYSLKIIKSQELVKFNRCGASWPEERWKIARRCGAKHISKSKCTKHTTFGPLLEVEMLKKCTLLWREALFQVKMYKTHHVRTTFGSWDVEKVYALVARSKFPSQNLQSTPRSDHFWKLRCWKSARRCGAKHFSKSKCTKHTIFGSWDVAKVHAPVARSTFPSQNVQNTPCTDHFWRFRCRFAWQAQGIVDLVKSEKNVRILLHF